MSEKEEIQLWHAFLKNRGKWYLDIYAPDIPEFQDIAEKAKSHADRKLSRMAFSSFWSAYKKWKKSDKIMSLKDDWYESFLNDLVCDLGLGALKGIEKDWYFESCYLKFMKI